MILDPHHRLHIIFRFDAGNLIGNGHLIRSLVLAQLLLHRGHQVKLLIRQLPANLQSYTWNLDIHNIPEKSDGLNELNQLHSENPIDWIVIDHYSIDASWEHLARPYTRRILVIDDLGNRSHDCDMLLDQNIENSLQKAYVTLVPASCIQLIGMDFLLARDNFYSDEQVERHGILVFLGGSNQSSFLSNLLNQLRLLCAAQPIHLLITREYGPKESWKAHLKEGDNLYSDVLDTSYLCRQAIAAVVRCGFISYELALLGVPMVIVYSTAIQSEVAMAFEKSGHGIALHEQDMNDFSALKIALDCAMQLSPTPLNRQLSPGSQRIAKLMENFNDY